MWASSASGIFATMAAPSIAWNIFIAFASVGTWPLWNFLYVLIPVWMNTPIYKFLYFNY